jgi:DUF1009 family protein
VTVAAILEETDSGIEAEASRAGGGSSVHWMGVGQLGRLIKTFKGSGVESVLMVGQVKHVRIFAPGSRSPLDHLKQLPDLRMIRVLASLEKRNTASLIQAIIDELGKEGIHIIDSTLFLQGLLADEGVMTSRSPGEVESKDLTYGREVAAEIARLDIGQTIVVKDQAVVAVEAMEGTDATIRRASEVVKGERLTVFKASRPDREMRYDVPVVGDRTLDVLAECSVSALGLDAGRTLILDKAAFLRRAAELKLTVVGFL